MERIEKLKKILENNPADSFIQHALALEYLKLGDDIAARQLFEELLKREPGYTGSYYHLAKLLERTGFDQEAVKWYLQGMDESKKAGELHTYGELKAAFEELTF